MLNVIKILFSVILISVVLFNCTQQKTEQAVGEKIQKKNVKRIGMVIGIKPEKIDEYKKVHADSNPGVRDLLSTYHMENFSIFLHQFDDGKYFLFGYYEYTGDDYEKDMALLDKEQRNIDWLSMTDPMQTPLNGESSWAVMEQVYFNQ